MRREHRRNPDDGERGGSGRTDPPGSDRRGLPPLAVQQQRINARVQPCNVLGKRHPAEQQRCHTESVATLGHPKDQVHPAPEPERTEARAVFGSIEMPVRRPSGGECSTTVLRVRHRLPAWRRCRRPGRICAWTAAFGAARERVCDGRQRLREFPDFVAPTSLPGFLAPRTEPLPGWHRSTGPHRHASTRTAAHPAFSAAETVSGSS